MWYVLKSPSLSLNVRDELNKLNIEFFLPTQNEVRTVRGKQVRVEKPVVFNFVFVNTDYDIIRDFCRVRTDLRLHVMFNRITNVSKEQPKPMVISNHEMEMFKKAIEFYNGQSVPFVKVEEMDFEKGDVVRIIGGRFNGLEGILVSQKGKDGGRVVVHLSNVIAISTLEIEPEYLQILKYGNNSKHFYKHLDSFYPRLERVQAIPKQSLKAEDLIPIKTFVSRFSQLQTDTINSVAKVQVLLLACYKLLDDKQKEEETTDKLKQIMAKVKSQTTIDFAKRWAGFEA